MQKIKLLNQKENLIFQKLVREKDFKKKLNLLEDLKKKVEEKLKEIESKLIDIEQDFMK